MGVMNFEMRFFLAVSFVFSENRIGRAGGNYASIQLILCSDCVQLVILVKQKKYIPY